MLSFDLILNLFGCESINNSSNNQEEQKKIIAKEIGVSVEKEKLVVKHKYHEDDVILRYDVYDTFIVNIVL